MDTRMRVTGKRLPRFWMLKYMPILERIGLRLRIPPALGVGVSLNRCGDFADFFGGTWEELPTAVRKPALAYWKTCPWRPHPLIDFSLPVSFMNTSSDWTVWTWQSRVYAALGAHGQHLVFHPLTARMPGMVFENLLFHMVAQVGFHAKAAKNPKCYWSSLRASDQHYLEQYGVDMSEVDRWCAEDGLPDLATSPRVRANGPGSQIQGIYKK